MTFSLHSLIKLISHGVFGKYVLFKIYQLNSDSRIVQKNIPETIFRPIDNPLDLEISEDSELAARSCFAGEDSFGFGAYRSGKLVAVCWFWVKDRYKERNFWPLQDNEAKLVDITTAAAYRGQGLAPALICFASNEMFHLGRERLYARIWHSHSSSLRAFEKSGWQYTAFVAEVFIFGIKKIRLVFRRK